jgi:hypothetical protein
VDRRRARRLLGVVAMTVTAAVGRLFGATG